MRATHGVLPALAVLLVAALADAACAQTPLQLKNLKDAPTQPRFTLPMDRVWPAAAGGADVCLWDDDRFAAMSITIDDNCAPDHDWWKQVTAQHGFKVTWFVITERPALGGYWGTWQAFRDLRALGHQVQSHTVTHLHADDPLWPGLDYEYRESINQIQANLPGHKVVALAYPGGTYSYLNDREVAALYYIAARSTVGAPNKANQTDYLSTNSAGVNTGRAYTDSVLFGTSTVSWLGGNKYLRGWLCTHFHGMAADLRATVETDLAYIKSVEADLWLGLFDEVVRYGQERDTVHLATVENTAQRVRFTLSDDMDDTLFDYPLTVKVRLYDAWPSASATQAGATIPLRVVVHDGARFALLRAIPDRGEIVVAPAPAGLGVTQWAVVASHAAAGSVITPVADGYVEPRAGGSLALQATFSAALDPATVQPGAVTVTNHAGGDLSSRIQALTLSPDARTLTVTLSAPLPDAERYVVALSDQIHSQEGQSLQGDLDLAIGLLAGDVNSSGRVTAADLIAVRAQAGSAVGTATARYDLDASGAITGADLLAVRRRLGAMLP